MDIYSMTGEFEYPTSSHAVLGCLIPVGKNPGYWSIFSWIQSVVILSYLRNAIFPKSCFRHLCHSNFVNTLLYITIFCAIPRLHRHRNLSQFLFKQSSASTSTTVAKISNKSLFELFFFGTLKRKLLPLFCQKSII